MASFAERLDSRRKNFKKGVDTEDSRRKREDDAVQLRKAKKDVQMQKRRFTQEEPDDAENVPCPTANAGNTGMGPLVQQAQHGDGAVRMDATVTMRKRLSVTHNPPVQEAIEAGVVPLMVTFLSSEDQQLQFEASWVLTNIASGDSHQTQAVVDGGAVPLFVQLLTSPSMESREQALWALANIAGDSTKSRDLVLGFDPVTPILQLIVESEQAGKVTILRNAVWALSNFCRGKPHPPLVKLAPALPFLGRLIHCTDVDVLSDTLWALSYLGDGPNERIDAVIQTGALAKVGELANSTDARLLQPALRVIGNVATGCDAHTDAAVQSGILRHMPALLSHTRSSIRKEVLWLLSNVTAGTRPQVQAVLESGCLPRVLELASTDTAEVRKEAVWVIANAVVSGSQEHIKYMAEVGTVTTLAQILDQVHDVAALSTALDALTAFLKAGERHVAEVGGVNPYCGVIEEAGGLCKLEQLQEDGNEDVYHKVVGILSGYFEEADDDAAVPECQPIPEGGFNFCS